jgi:hypothetical protein
LSKKILVILAVAVSVGGIWTLLDHWSDSTLRKVEKFGNIKVGMLIPSFGGVSAKGRQMGPGKPDGKFFIYLIDEGLPPVCLDDECGNIGRIIRERGGHLFGSSDGKMASAIGVKIKPGEPYAFEIPVAVLTDAGSKIQAIYENAKLSDVNQIISDINLNP